VLTLVYVAFWLAFAMLLSILLRRAASSALIAFGLWAGVVMLGSIFLLQLIANVVAPIRQDAGPQEQIGAAQTQAFIKRLSPHTLYTEASRVLLIPVDPVSNGAFTPATIEEAFQATDERRYLASRLSIEQSLLLVWPQVVGLAALTTVVFGAAYVVFMRQEVRA
jgi:ABC-2 type transport system permease protein